MSPTAVPFTSVPLGKTTFQITTSVGRSLQTYDLRRGLNLVFLGRPQCPHTITATYAYRDRVFVAWGGERPDATRGVWIFRRGRYIDELEVPADGPHAIEQILVFGAWIIGCGSHAIQVWKSDTYEHYTTIIPTAGPRQDSGRVLSGLMCTLPTFLNKIFVGRQDGNIEIYNVSTAKLVHTIPPSAASMGQTTAISAASTLGMLAVGYADGSVVILDAETDEDVMTLRQVRSTHPVTSISFRTDGAGAGEDGRKEGVMATSSTESGDITLWDLNRGGKVVGVLRGAHETSSISAASGINKVEFLPGQPVLVSTGRDNALRSWVFDQTPFSPVPRLLHSRSGHAAMTTELQFLPAASDGSEAAGKWLLSAGRDRSLWGFSLRKDGQSTELSQGNIRHKAKKQGQLTDDSSVESFKAPPIVDMACSLNRDGGMGAASGPVWSNQKSANAEESNMTGWESIVTAHDGDSYARTWFWGRKKAGRWAFETGDKKPVTKVAVTACGTFAVVGSAGGSLDMFNLQSGVHRQRFPPRIKPAQAKQLKLRQAQSDEPIEIHKGHNDGITGIVVDNLNQTVISSGLDGTVIFWDFVTGSIITKTYLEGSAAIAMRYNSVSGLVSLSCDDLCIRVLDVETKKTVRELWGCVGQIYDHCFSHDGRWIVACSMDSVVRVFDLATGHLIDAFRTATCTNVAFSSTGEFLATTHAGSIGINVWNNKSLYAHIPSRQIDEDTGVIDLTTSIDFHAANQLAIESEQVNGEDAGDQTTSVSEIDQLDASLLTLSLVPQSRWQTLLNLETIRQRNKPIQPPDKPKAAPFFLGSTLTKGEKPANQAMIEPQDGAFAESDRSRISRLASQQPSTLRIASLLLSSKSDPAPLIDHLISLSPSAADLEIRSLTLTEMPIFVEALTAQLSLRKDFELVNTWMSVFLKVHGDFVGEVDRLREAVVEWKQAMENEEKRLSDMVGYTKGVVEFLRSAR